MEKSGVSRGTVDRVLFDRGRVSQKTRDKVLKAIEELGYIPNSNASILASRKTYLISCLIPAFKAGEYWEAMYEGFISAAKSLRQRSVEVRIHLYDQRNSESFKTLSQEILSESPSGVIMNAVFREEVTAFASDLETNNTPYAFVDNKIDELDYVLYYGVDPSKSGSLGAFLLTDRTDPSEIVLVRLQRDPAHRADPNRPRRHGFTDYIEDRYPECKIHMVTIDPEAPETILGTLEEFFRAHPGVHHVAMTNSRIFLLREYLEKHPDPNRIVVGFDDLKENLECLNRGLINCLVTRHIPQQAHDALKAFADCIARNERPEVRNRFVHMDILTRMNTDNY
ncbi:MAG: LacI family DNA-binding transcriptional regulator [Bacteroidales bacterium]|nr:LacI family DNA-binding transcriptional regulator [Bacteroidales bacterium]